MRCTTAPHAFIWTNICMLRMGIDSESSSTCTCTCHTVTPTNILSGAVAQAKAFSHLGTHAHGQDGHVALCISLYPLFAISLYPYPYTHSSHAPHQCQDKAPIAITPTNMYISVWVPTPCFMHSLLHAAMPMAHAFMRMGALCVWGLYAYGGFMRMGALCVCGLHAYGGFMRMGALCVWGLYAYGGFMRMGEQWAIGIKTVGIGG